MRDTDSNENPDYLFEEDSKKRYCQPSPCGNKSQAAPKKAEIDGKDNKTIFTERSIADTVIEYLKDHDILGGMDEETISQHKDGITDKLRETFEEIEKVSELQRQFHAVTEKPSESFADSGLRAEQYIRKYYKRSISAGVLIVSDIDDEKLRRKISSEKARGVFPSDLNDICLTSHDLLVARRRAMYAISGLDRSEKETMNAFARGLVDRHRKENRHTRQLQHG